MTVAGYLVKADAALQVGKRVLFVEGPADTAVYSEWLKKIDALFAAKVVIVECGGRTNIIKALVALGNHGDVYALHDRNGWDHPKVVAVQAAHPHLLINENRHTLESYFCDPVEIQLALHARNAGKYDPLFPALETAVVNAIPPWVDHWALWTALMRVQDRMNDAKLPSFFHHIIPIPADPDIAARMGQWSNIVDDVQMFAEFDALRTNARGQAQSIKLRSCVYSPLFFSQVVLPQLRILEGDDEQTWKVNLAEWAPSVPADLLPLLQMILH